MCFVPEKTLKNTNRAVTEAYRTPKKIRVGIMKLKEMSWYLWLPREPKAGAVL